MNAKGNFMKNLQIFFAGLIICVFCFGCSDQMVIKEINSRDYLVDGKKHTPTEVIQRLKAGNFPGKILFIGFYKKANPHKDKVIQMLDDLDKKKKVQVWWKLPSNDADLEKNDGDMGYTDNI